MTPQEQQMLQGLTERINQTVLQDKDPEAEQFLGQSLSRNPDAVYILAQTVLVQQYALEQAKKQLEDAKQQVQQAQQPVKHTSFLGSLLGTDEPRQAAPPPPPPQPYNQAQYQPVPNYPPQPPYGQQQYGQPQYPPPQYAQPGFGAPQGSGFLGSALRTAGGVAAGALAFEGIESLMHGFGGHGGYGSGLGNFAAGGQPREEVINNYYDGERPGQQGLSSDIEDRRDEHGRDNFTDSADNNQFDDNTAADTTDYGSDDSGSSDGGSDFGSDDNS